MRNYISIVLIVYTRIINSIMFGYFSINNKREKNILKILVNENEIVENHKRNYIDSWYKKLNIRKNTNKKTTVNLAVTDK